ncbi:MAG TPA: SDR family NAD(P)-dependent oxidoreductase [Oligoflexia bacterium]|nr:SDR family NAD(P)-dependent oxidoreductase [Oligoflexia bacterium]HMR25305.1 SDR family NAD(P)-dependent oxidoreductase [Oligoflexia bacterium]
MQLSSESVVVITGASKGIGRVTALRLAQYKCNFILVARSENLLQQLTQELAHIGAKAIYIVGDLSKKSTATKIVHSIHQQFKRIDVLINNAGYGYYAPIEQINDKNLENIFRCNLLAPLWLMQKLAPLFKQQGYGHIVNVSSVIGIRSIPGSSAYCMSKFALNALDESAYLELKPYGVNFSLICPGLTKTEFQENSNNPHLNPGLSNKLGASAESVAKAIDHAIASNKRRVYLTFWGKLLVYLQRLSPSLLDWIMLYHYKKRSQEKNAPQAFMHNTRKSS